jgi:hypothetical protein
MDLDSFSDYYMRPDNQMYQVQERTEFRPPNVPFHDLGQAQNTMRYRENEQTDRRMESQRAQDETGDLDSILDRARTFAGVGSSLETRDDTWHSVVQPWVTANGLPIIQNSNGTDLDAMISSMGQIQDRGKVDPYGSHIGELYGSQDIVDAYGHVSETPEYRHPGNDSSLYKSDRVEMESVPTPYEA